MKDTQSHEEFIIEKSDRGKWIINIENYSIQDESNPTFIKYTTRILNFFKDNFNYKTKKVSYDEYIKEAYPS